MEYYYNLANFFKQVTTIYSEDFAIKFHDRAYTYKQVDSDASKIARFLINQDLKKGDVIAIANDKQYLTYVLMLAAIKTGVTYTNIDPLAPEKWIQNIFKTCKPKLFFTNLLDQQNSTRFEEVVIIDIDNLSEVLKYDESYSPIESQFDGDTIAYIMFTSGSTGTPKGVAITHQNLIHFINWGIKRYQVCSADIFANVSPMYFDNSVFDFYVSLFSGACLAPIHRNIVSQPKKLLDYVDIMECTIWFSVPSLLIYLNVSKVLTPTSFKSIRIITFGGEGFPKSELLKIYDLFKDRTTFINVYGPTECTCICSSYTISECDFASLNNLPPLGNINQNISFLILNDKNQMDVIGELYLLGPNVAAGYYNDFVKTQAHFSYFSDYGYYNEKMYRTGDIVKFENGLLHFIGRKDNQIKHMGYRIELETIEIAISKIPNVNEVAVIYDKVSTKYGKILGFIGTSNKELASDEIRKFLMKEIPNYMIPTDFYFLDYLPKNANGKIDRVKLKQFDGVNA